MPFLERPCGWRLYHEIHGPADGEPIVLLEGMGGDIPGWRRTIPRLARELRVVAYDLRGNGRSEGPDGPTTMATYALDTVALLDHLGIDRARVYGMEDQMVPVENARILAERIPGAELVLVEGAGHLYHSERAEEADAAVLDFVRRHRGIRRGPPEGGSAGG